MKSAPMPLGAWILWPETDSVSTLGPLLQVDGDAQPSLHRVYMEVGAAVFSLDALGQGSNVLHVRRFRC